MIDDDRGQLTTPAALRALLGGCIALVVLILILYESFEPGPAPIQQEPAPVIDPWLIGVLFALGGVVILTQRFRSQIADRDSANGDRDSAKEGDAS